MGSGNVYEMLPRNFNSADIDHVAPSGADD